MGKLDKDYMEEKYKEGEAIAGEWLDSPEAMDIAREYFDEESAENYWFGLSSEDGFVTWYIKSDPSEGILTWVEVNALTGELTETRMGY